MARLEAEIEDNAQKLAHFTSAEDSMRLAKSIEQGREELARLTSEWEATAKAIESQETEAEE